MNATRLRWAGLAAAVLIPLAFVGLYTASVGDPSDGIDNIPAAVVNADEMVTTVADDGTESRILAGRQLVTELTGDDSPGMRWQLSNAEDAAAMLASGEVYAVLTIPSDFSSSIVSLQGDDPHKAQLEIQTDDAHSYLAGTVAQSLGDNMVRTFGTAITENYISGIYAGFGKLSEAMTEASAGAGRLADGATSAAGGAQKLTGGLSSYTGGVSQLSGGLAQLRPGSAQVASGVKSFTGGISQLSAGIAAATAALAANPNDPVALATLQGYSAQLSAAAAKGPALASGAAGVSSGIAQSASGASTLAANGPALVSGASGLASGIAKLADGADELSTGLADGAAQLPSDDGGTSDAAAVAADPVTLTVSTANSISGPGSAIATLFVPIGLWIGALAMFLVLRPASRRALASTATSGRLVASALVRAGAIAAIQAALLVVLLHTAGGVAWSVLPATLLFAVLIAAAFTAFHYLLTIGLGRGGLVISLLGLALQIAAVGGILPSEALAGPFPALRPFMPLTWAVDGMQQLVTGGSAGIVVGSAAALLALAVGSIVVAVLGVRRTRNRVLVPAVA